MLEPNVALSQPLLQEAIPCSKSCWRKVATLLSVLVVVCLVVPQILGQHLADQEPSITMAWQQPATTKQFPQLASVGHPHFLNLAKVRAPQFLQLARTWKSMEPATTQKLLQPVRAEIVFETDLEKEETMEDKAARAAQYILEANRKNHYPDDAELEKLGLDKAARLDIHPEIGRVPEGRIGPDGAVDFVGWTATEIRGKASTYRWVHLQSVKIKAPFFPNKKSDEGTEIWTFARIPKQGLRTMDDAKDSKGAIRFYIEGKSTSNNKQSQDKAGKTRFDLVKYRRSGNFIPERSAYRPERTLQEHKKALENINGRLGRLNQKLTDEQDALASAIEQMTTQKGNEESWDEDMRMKVLDEWKSQCMADIEAIKTDIEGVEQERAVAQSAIDQIQQGKDVLDFVSKLRAEHKKAMAEQRKNGNKYDNIVIDASSAESETADSGDPQPAEQTAW